MAAEESAAELTPEQKIENMLFPEAEPEPSEDLEAVAEETAEIDDSEAPGDELEAEPEVDEDAEEIDQELRDIEIDGDVFEVPPKIYDAIMRESDYTQKTQALAADRDAVSVVRDQLTQSQQQYEFLESIEEETQRSQSIDWQVSQLRQYMRENIDSLSGNQLEKVRWQIDELTTEKDGIVAALRTKYGEFQQAAEQAKKELRDKSTEALKSRLPNWGDEAEQQALTYAKEIGFTDQEIEAALDPRERQVLWEASEYRRLKAGAGQAARTARAAPKIKTKARPGHSQETRRKISIRKRLNNEPDQKKKARIIQEDIAQRLNL